MKIKFNPKKWVAQAVIIVILGFSISLLTPAQPVAYAQDECTIGEATLDIDVLCWAVDAANFVITNNLFSIFDAEDLRDAVKHYRFYQLVISELSQ